MLFHHNPLVEDAYWFEDCPMLNPTFIDFFKSNKKFLFVYCDIKGEYGGDFFDVEPQSNIFIKSNNMGDTCGAIFKRNFSKSFNLESISSLEKALDFIDSYEC